VDCGLFECAIGRILFVQIKEKCIE